MRLLMADIHLYRTRLFLPRVDLPLGRLGAVANGQEWHASPSHRRDDLAAAEKLINECGYHRRDEELTRGAPSTVGPAKKQFPIISS
jgi:predicted RNase H-like nuclease (RuvC/YqgF family)